MSYLVLARKWRPQGFDDLIGQEPIIRVLKNSISQNKIAHAYIFSGPRGVGKTSTARILAKALNCEHGTTSSPCGTCALCMAIKDGSSVDVLEIDGASNNSVDDIRDLREGVKYTPLGGRYKVYIIDEAHMLSTSAFNALLKTLEEPPPHAIFVLATTAPRKIPATVFSRCQHLPFRRIPSQKIKERLKHITASEVIKISDSAIEMIARAADGSMRDSLTILDQISSFSSAIEESDIKDLLGIADIGMLSEIATAIIDCNHEKIIKVIAELVDGGIDLRSFTKDLVEFFRDLLIAKIVQKPEEMLELGEDEMDAIRKILPKVSHDILTLVLSEIVKAELDVRSAFSPRVTLEMSLIRASLISTLKPIREAIENIDAIVSELRTQSSEPMTLMDGGSLLNTIIEKVEDPRIASRLAKATPLLKGDTLRLTFNSNEADIFAEPIRKKISLVEGIASDILQNPTKIEIDIQAKKVIRKKDIHARVLSDPAVQEVIELFEGKIIDVKQKENTGGERSV